MTPNSVIGRSAIIGSIGSELINLIVDLLHQRFQLRGIASFVICQAMGNDLATVGIKRQVQFSPAAARLYAMLLLEPLANTIDFEPKACRVLLSSIKR
jgi:hypothetical protein